MEIFDVIDKDGNPTGETVTRERAHAEGIPHRTAHIWILRKKEGRIQVLLQKRSKNKDSFPGMFDTSSAGHIQAGDEPLESALRELEEELGTPLFVRGHRSVTLTDAGVLLRSRFFIGLFTLKVFLNSGAAVISFMLSLSAIHFAFSNIPYQPLSFNLF